MSPASPALIWAHDPSHRRQVVDPVQQAGLLQALEDAEAERRSTSTENTSTSCALPLKVTVPSAFTAISAPRAERVAASMRIGHAASLVCVSRRAARFTVSPMQV